MTKTLFSDRPRLISIYEFQHHSKMIKNRAYAINGVDKAISRGQITIQLDKTKLECKVYTGTTCSMYNRLGEPMKIQYIENSVDRVDNFTIKTSSKQYTTVEGYSTPQHGDKFARYEGRMNALRNAYSNMQLIKSDPNFDDLLVVKRFINAFELKVNCTTVSYQFMDLWLAILSNNEQAIAEAGRNYVGLEQYNDWFAECLVTFREGVAEYEMCEGALNSVDKYTLFKTCIKRCNSSLF